MTRYILRGCRRCGGDLFLHDQYHSPDDWLCMQCGRYRHQQRFQATDHNLPDHRTPQAAAASARPDPPMVPGG